MPTLAPIASEAVPAPAPIAAPLPAAAAPGPSWLPWAALAAVLALGALAWLRRGTRVKALPAPDAIPDTQPETPVAKPAPRARATVADTGANTATDTDIGQPLVFTLEPARVSATLVNAALSYRLIASNRGTTTLSDIAINGDMIAAHSSRPMEELLGLTGPELPPLHHIATLAPGEQVTLGGEMRLLLSAIMPIRHGAAHLFVPLARFDAWATVTNGGAVHARAAFLVGQETEAANSRLQPFRLDLGPRVYDRIGQRALAVPAP